MAPPGPLSLEVPDHRLRRSGVAGLAVRSIHRLLPSNAGGSRVRHGTRRALRAGLLVELAGGASEPRVIDAVAAAAGGGPAHTFQRGSGGAALARARHGDGTELLLRAAPPGSPGDPARIAAALRKLSALDLTVTPSLRGQGRLGEVSWSAESLLPGSPPWRLWPALVDEVVDVCTRLPRSDASPTAPLADLEVLTAALPERSAELRALGDAMAGMLRDLPSVLRHGDLWTGNLLVVRGRLSGIVDWDAMHPAAVCGADVLQLLATAQRHRSRRPLGSIWLTRPWESEAYRSATAPYWRTLGVAPPGRATEVVGLAWWAAAAAGTVARAPARASDERWVRINIDPVLAALGWRP
jgi:hypothetical protein